METIVKDGVAEYKRHVSTVAACKLVQLELPCLVFQKQKSQTDL